MVVKFLKQGQINVCLQWGGPVSHMNLILHFTTQIYIYDRILPIKTQDFHKKTIRKMIPPWYWHAKWLSFGLQALAITAGRLTQVFGAVAAEVTQRTEIHAVGNLGERQAVVIQIAF